MAKSKKGNLEAAWAEYGIKQPDLLTDTMVERMWQAYQAATTKSKPSMRDFITNVKHIEEHGADRVITSSKEDSTFIGIVMTTMNQVREAQGHELASISMKESLNDSGGQSFEYHIDAVPEHFSDVVGLLIRQRTENCAKGPVARDRIIRTNPAVPSAASAAGMTVH